jgi:hypothetical protein
MLKFYPVVLNMLLNVICSRSDAIAKEAIIAITVVLGKIQTLPNQSSRSNLLAFFVNYMFRNFPNSPDVDLVFQALAKHWAKTLESKSESAEQTFEHCWFFFEIIIKSMTLFLHDTSQLSKKKISNFFYFYFCMKFSLFNLFIYFLKDSDSNRPSAFSSTFVGTLKNLLRETGAYVISSRKLHLARTTAYFLKDLLGLMDRGFVQQLISDFITHIDPKNSTNALVSIKFAVMKILCAYEHFVPLCLPIAPEFTSVSTFVMDNWKRHFLVGLLLDELNSCFNSPEFSTRVKALTTLRDVLWKIDITPAYNDPQRKTRIANMFFPFLLIVSFFHNFFFQKIVI